MFINDVAVYRFPFPARSVRPVNLTGTHTIANTTEDEIRLTNSFVEFKRGSGNS